MGWGLLEVLAPDVRAAVERRLQRRRYKRGGVVFNEGDPGDSLFVVASGRFDVQTTTPAGTVVVLRLMGAGEFFGEMALVRPDHTRTGRCTALEDGELLRLLRADFDELRDGDPALDRLLVAVLAERVAHTTEQLVELLMPVEARVYRRLASLAESYPRDGELPLTQDELARMTGATRQTVNRVLRAAATDGHLRLGRRSITVLDPAGLAALAHGPLACEERVRPDDRVADGHPPAGEHIRR